MAEHLSARPKRRTNGLFFRSKVLVQRIEQAVGSLLEPKSGVAVFNKRKVKCCAVSEILAHNSSIASKEKTIESMHLMIGLLPLAGSLLFRAASKQSNDQKNEKNTVSGQEMQFIFG